MAEENENQGGVIGTDNENKLNRRNEIADNLDKMRAGELEDLDGGVVSKGPGEEEDDGPGDERVEEKKFKLRVNGRDMELTEAEIIERAQKVESADEYLKSAAETARNATRLALPPDEPEKVEEDDLALARALQMGSEEDAAKAIRKLRSRPSEVTPDAVVRAVDDRLTFRKAVDKFNDEYQDILADPILKSIVFQKDAELFEKEPTLDYSERLSRVGKEVRAWAQKLSGPKVDKLARKASVAPVPSASGRQALQGEDEGEEDPETVIAQMAKARKQDRPVKH